MLLPAPIQNLIDAFSRLPGIGPKTASRLTFYLLRAGDEQSTELAAALPAPREDHFHLVAPVRQQPGGMWNLERFNTS